MDILEEMGNQTSQSGQQKQEGATAPKTANAGGVASGAEEGEPTQVAIPVAQGGGRRHKGSRSAHRRYRKGRKSHKRSHKHRKGSSHRKSRRQQ